MPRQTEGELFQRHRFPGFHWGVFQLGGKVLILGRIFAPRRPSPKFAKPNFGEGTNLLVRGAFFSIILEPF
jgi:hypothetical protein